MAKNRRLTIKAQETTITILFQSKVFEEKIQKKLTEIGFNIQSME